MPEIYERHLQDGEDRQRDEKLNTRQRDVLGTHDHGVAIDRQTPSTSAVLARYIHLDRRLTVAEHEGLGGWKEVKEAIKRADVDATVKQALRAKPSHTGLTARRQKYFPT
ncbi:MAG: hypothetical protein H6816_11470 [Phycisphaerales bacterium]|nr:hypothetical protein [Phycisphaerales bacterium]